MTISGITGMYHERQSSLLATHAGEGNKNYNEKQNMMRMRYRHLMPPMQQLRNQKNKSTHDASPH